MSKTAVLIAGPTASGKSALALELAKRNNGLIINADSMQVYSVLNRLSARPQEDELAQAEHLLYGFVEPEIRFSTGAWLRAVEDVLKSPAATGRELIFVGGTGLYFQALINGFTNIPAISPKVVYDVENKVAGLSRDERVDILQKLDPEMALRLVEPDHQRLVRALSVLKGTGRSLAQWQDEEQTGVLGDFALEKIVISPDRALLRKRILDRFDKMWDHGAVTEVEALLALDLDPSLPVMKAIGVREISEWLRGGVIKSDAMARAVIASHQYAKRQRTWFRKQMADWAWRE